MDFGCFGGGFNLTAAGLGVAVGDVVKDRVIEKHGVLRHHANGLMQRGLRDITNVLAVDFQRAVQHIIKTEQQPSDGGFARAGRADNGHGLTGLDCQGHPF